MFFTSSITQVSHTTRPITPDTAAIRPAARNTSSSRLISFTGGRAFWLTMALSVLAALFASSISATAEPWKACAFNDQAIGCRDVHHANGSLTIHWQDGLSMTYRLIEEGFPRSLLRDSLGGVWRREVLVQGNAVFTHAINGNRIVVPLR
jgi:hypothetical protein